MIRGDNAEALTSTGGLPDGPGAGGGGHWHDMESAACNASTVWHCLARLSELSCRCEHSLTAMVCDRSMLVIGNYEPRTGANCITTAEEQTQFAIWSISARCPQNSLAALAPPPWG